MQISLLRLAFDRAIIETALHHDGGEQHKGSMSKLQHICTMNSSTEVLKLPGKYGKKSKWPSLFPVTLALLTAHVAPISKGAADTETCLAVFRAR
jgi:hypothetical protein